MSASRPADADVTAWALAAKAGDRAAAAAFIRATQLDVHRFLVHLTDPGEVEDLSQETYLRAMRSLPSFDARSSAKTWLFAIARRVAADHIRSLLRRPRTVPGWDAAEAGWDAAGRGGREPATHFDEGVVLGSLLRDLDSDRREAFVATQILGLSYAEAAEVCDCPVGTIRSRVSRAREDLVAALHADQGSGDRAGGKRDGGHPTGTARSHA
jgi:RNA polymerase sigma-70 factor (ECF subfamily)